MDFQKIKLALIFSSILICLNVIYFFIYFSLLDLPFTLLHFFFVLIAAVSYFLLYNFFRWRLWRFVCASAFFIFYFASLVNFAYYSVYRSFIDFSFEQSSQINFTMVKHLKDFWFLVPTKLFVLAAIVFLAIIINAYLYRRFREGRVKLILSNPRPLELFFEPKRKTRETLLLLILFLIINSGAFSVSSYLYNNPRDTWWNLQKQLTDLGFWGYFYSQVYAQSKNGKDESAADKTWLEETKDVYNQTARLSEPSAAGLARPTFSQTPNIVIIQLESIPSWAVENEPSAMPFLKSLMAENIIIPNFHSNSCETINSEFSSLCGFWPDSLEPVNYSHKNKQYRCLPTILKEDFGYGTNFFHANVPEFWNRDVLIPKWGFDQYYSTPYFRQKQDDISVFEKAVNEMANQKKPFFSYLLSFTTHAPHNDELIQYQWEKNGVKIESFSGELNPWLVNSVEIDEADLRKYLGFMKVTDDALKVFFEKMKAKNLLKNTIILIHGDHRFYNFRGQDEKLIFDAYNRVPFVMVLPDGQKGVLQNLSSQLDIAPTLLNMVVGEKYQPVAHFLGQSMFAPNFVPQVLNKCLNQIYFTNGELIIEGNAKSNLYHVLTSRQELSSLAEDNWLRLIGELVKKSDETIFNDGLSK
ncbi:LTA synthase family protein [Candidatus Falkowbacteria bacterium]|nr:LTA synthase family protein [Candidatus Falkowbacteria bacterium]